MILFGWETGTARRGITGILEGTVRDKQSKQSLPAVNVLILGLNRGGITDEKGQFHIGNIRAGDYDIRFSMVGYKTVQMNKVTILPDLRTRLNIELEVSSVELSAVEVTAARPLIQVDQAVTAFNVSEAKLDRLPLTKFQDVIGLQPGVTQEGNVRGGKTTDALYLVDGLPVQDVISGGIGTSIPKSSISGVTVMTGGMDAEYGNAMSGVINVVTKSGGENHELNVRFERDNWLPERIDKQVDKALELEATASGPIVTDKLYYFTANILALSDTRWWQDFQRFDPSPIKQEYSGLTKFEYIVTPTMRLGLQGIYSLQRWRDYEFSWRFDLNGLPVRLKDSFRGALTLSNTISEQLFYTISLSGFTNRTRINQGSKQNLSLIPFQYDIFLKYIVDGSRNWWEDTWQNIYTLKGDVTWQPLTNHLIKMGVTLNQYDTYSDVVKYDPQTTYFGKPLPDAPMLNYSNTYEYWPRSGSIYVQDKIQIVEDGSNVSFGLRWDFLDPTAERPIVEYVPVTQSDYTEQVTGKAKSSLKQQLSPRISLALPVNPETFLFFNIGYYVQFPVFEYLYSGLNPVQLRQGAKNVLAGNPNLEPERSALWEAGLKQTLRGDAVLSVTCFAKQMTNQIDALTLVPFNSRYAGDYGFAMYVNNAAANAYGLEVVLGRERDERVAGSISYTCMVTDAESEYADQNINIAQWGFKLAPLSYPLSWDQRHSVKGDFDFKMFNQIQSNIVILYNSPRPYTYFPTRDGYTPVDTSKLLVPNNRRMEDFLTINWKLSTTFKFSFLNGADVTLYADIRNLLNRRNVRWMDSNGRVGGELGDPSAYYDPRRVKVGIRVDM